jgi:hypothetical protein
VNTAPQATQHHFSLTRIRRFSQDLFLELTLLLETVNHGRIGCQHQGIGPGASGRLPSFTLS